MSKERLQRQRGIIIRCDYGQIVTTVDGKTTHHAHCPGAHFTGNTRIDVNREEAARNGWRRDSLPTGKRRRKLDICPTHVPVAKRIIAERDAKRRATQKAKAERAKARLAKKAA